MELQDASQMITDGSRIEAEPLVETDSGSQSISEPELERFHSLSLKPYFMYPVFSPL